MPVQVVRKQEGQQELDFLVSDFHGLLNVAAMPQSIGDEDLTICQNYYGSLYGGVYQRKGQANRGAALPAPPFARIDGLFRFEQLVINGAVQSPSFVRTLVQCGGNLYTGNATDTTYSQVGANNVLGSGAFRWSACKVFDPDHAGGASDVMVICTGVGGPYLYDGSTVTVPAAWSANAPAARWCQLVNNILFFAGLPSQPNLIVGMALGHPETLAIGAQNNFTTSYPITGLTTLGAGATAGLVAGMVQGLAVVYGTGLANFYEQDVPAQDGPVSGYALVAVDGITYFLGRDDFYAFDGNNVVPLGLKVRPYILNDGLFTNPWDIPMSGPRTTTWLMYYNKRLYLWYDSGGGGHANVALVWDMNLHGWTTFTGPTNACGALLNASTDSSPLQCIVGSGTAAQISNFDVYNGAAHNVDDNGVAINALMQTKFYKVGQPGTQKRLLRVYPELFTETFNGSVLATANYLSGPTIIGGVSVPSSGPLWDVALWDVALWGAGVLVFVEPRIEPSDANEFFEAIALGMQSTVVQAPHWVQAFDGRFSQQTMMQGV
jgi:hypothetical protein